MIYLFGVYSYVLRLVQQKKKDYAPLEAGWTIAIINGHASVYGIERRLGSDSVALPVRHAVSTLCYTRPLPQLDNDNCNRVGCRRRAKLDKRTNGEPEPIV